MSDTFESGIRGVDVAGPSDAPSIVFVHGAVLTRKMWAPQRDRLSADRHVIAPDLPGHGERSGRDFRMEPAIDLLDGVIERVADGNALLVGLSLGGYVSTTYAHRYPDKVDGLVISGSSANPVGSLAAMTRVVAGTTRLTMRSRLLERGARAMAKRWVKAREISPASKREIIEAGFYPRQFGESGPDLAGTDFRAAFASYPGPALVLNGSKDVINRRGERAHADAAADARVEVLEGAGHACNLHRPQAFTDGVRRFERRALGERSEPQ